MNNTVPIVFAFDNNLSMPASVCIFSLLKNAKDTTTYDIFILKREGEELDLSLTKKVLDKFPRHKLSIRSVGDTFDNSFEIRGITTPTYYRLLIPSIIQEYDKVIYSDVDVIFRQDLSEIYNEDLKDFILAGVSNLANIDRDLFEYYGKNLKLNPGKIICAGFLIMNIKYMRENGLEEKFIGLVKNRYKFQDQDVLNLSCSGKIMILPPKFSLLTYTAIFAFEKESLLLQMWSKKQIEEALNNGNIHYNGQKPWKGYCLNFDIWWEYYRKSPIFDEKLYFKFFFKKLDELDTLTLWKRIKILARYFIVGKK